MTSFISKYFAKKRGKPVMRGTLSSLQNRQSVLV